METIKSFCIGLLLFTIVISSASAMSIRPPLMILRGNLSYLPSYPIIIGNTENFTVDIEAVPKFETLTFQPVTPLNFSLEPNENISFEWNVVPTQAGNFSDEIIFEPMNANLEMAMAVGITSYVEGDGTPSQTTTTTTTVVETTVPPATTIQSGGGGGSSPATTTIKGITATVTMGEPTNETSTTTTMRQSATTTESTTTTIISIKKGMDIMNTIEDYFFIILGLTIIIGASIGIYLKRRKVSK